MKSLKAQWRARPQPKPAAPVTPAAPAPDLDFKRHVGAVIPQADDGRVHFTPPRPSPHPRKQNRPQQDTAPPHAVGGFEPAHSEQHFLRPGMQSQTLRKLRAGHWPICAELDLHGLDRYQAQDRLAVFVHRARGLGQCVRVIHGRGIGSQGEPILKRITRTWLSHHPDILAWCESHDGGALLVLLRRMMY